LTYTSEVNRRDALLVAAAQAAEEIGEPDVVCTVLSIQSLIGWRPADLMARRRQADELSSLATALGNRHFAMEARRLRIVAALDAGDIAALDSVLADHATLAADGFGVHRWRSAMWRTMRLVLRGDQTAAESNMREARAQADLIGHPDAFFWFAAQLLQLRWDQDRVGELEPTVESLAATSPGVPLWRAVLAAMCADTGRLDEAVLHAERVRADVAAMHLGHPNPFAALLAMAEGLAAATLLADAVAATRDATGDSTLALARDLFDALEPYAEHGVMAGPAVIFLGCVAHRLASLAMVIGDVDAAKRYFELARLRYERMGAAPWSARLLTERAVKLARTSNHDRGEIDALLDMATQTAHAVGMPGLLRRITELRQPSDERRHRIVPTATGEDLDRYAALTDRERDVVRLMATGRTNPQIADELFIANKTVMHHAASIYRKLGVHGRAEAAAFIARIETVP
jgi:DNA-binding CsgD family transcriptional regulator